MYELQSAVAPQSGRLLCLLLLRHEQVPASSGAEGLLRLVRIALRIVHWRLFDLNVTAARAANAGVAADEVEDAIEQMLTEVRAERFRKPI